MRSELSQMRKGLLDTLEALADYRTGVIVIGSQAIYLQVPEDDLPVAPATKDSDLAFNPREIEGRPDIWENLVDRGFRLRSEQLNPGLWETPDGIPVDLLVPLAAEQVKPGRRSGKVIPHAKRTFQAVSGIEAAVVSNHELLVRSLTSGDGREIKVKVASPGALVVAKLVKIGERIDAERVNQGKSRVRAKDALDIFRILRAYDPKQLAEEIRIARESELAGACTKYAIECLEKSGFDPDKPQKLQRISLLAGESLGNDESIVESMHFMLEDLYLELTVSE